MFICPHCKQNSVTLLQKYALSHWRWADCRHCHYRLSANPILLALVYMLYVWIIMLTVYLVLSFGWIYLLLGIVMWLMLDALSIWLIPMHAIKPAAARSG